MGNNSNSDDFNRTDNLTVGNGWTEIENARIHVKILSNQLKYEALAALQIGDVAEITRNDSVWLPTNHPETRNKIEAQMKIVDYNTSLLSITNGDPMPTIDLGTGLKMVYVPIVPTIERRHKLMLLEGTTERLSFEFFHGILIDTPSYPLYVKLIVERILDTTNLTTIWRHRVATSREPLKGWYISEDYYDTTTAPSKCSINSNGCSATYAGSSNFDMEIDDVVLTHYYDDLKIVNIKEV